jgi:hypothetical protein
MHASQKPEEFYAYHNEMEGFRGLERYTKGLRHSSFTLWGRPGGRLVTD